MMSSSVQSKINPTRLPSEDVPETEANVLSSVMLSKVIRGRPEGAPFPASNLWADEPVAVLVVRRPGCPLCRLDARQLSNLFKSEFDHIKLIAIVKEVEKDGKDLLGVQDFKEKYFNNNEVYYDKDAKFYEYFGKKNVINQPLHSYNPCRLVGDFFKLWDTLKENDICEYNWNGSAWIKGGFLMVVPDQGIVYRQEEVTGARFPYVDITHEVMKINFKYNL